MKPQKTKNRAAGVIILIAGVLAIAGGLLYLYFHQGPQHFTSWKKNQAAKLYDEIMEYNYGGLTTPEGVLEINNKINLLLYGDMLTGEELLEDILKKQRMLYDDTLLELNPYDVQLFALKTGLNEYKNNKTTCYDISISTPPVHSRDNENIYEAMVTWQTNNMGNINWEYILSRDENGMFKILRFAAVK